MSLEAIQADFDRIARLTADKTDRPGRYESFLLTQLPTPCGKVLEVGCGAGRLARTIAARGAVVTGIDASPEMIRLARSHAHNGIPIEFVCGDFSVHPMTPGTYDCVVSVTTLHHLSAAATLARMKSILRPAGLLVIHDMRSFSGIADALASALVALLNGDAVWWILRRLREGCALRDAWRDHGLRERYLTMPELRGLCEKTLPGARTYWHPLRRYTVVWTKAA